MSAKISIGLPKSESCVCANLLQEGLAREAVDSRQRNVFGFDQSRFSGLTVMLIGAGGINGEIGEGLVRKGIGEAIILDGDEVQLSNLNRQLFCREDIAQNKATRLIQNLRGSGFMGTKLTAFPFYFEEAIEKVGLPKADLLICGVDHNPTRVFVSKHARTHSLPVIFTAVSRDANQGYVFIQDQSGPCFGCVLPEAVNDDDLPCPDTPAIKDILKVVAGFVLYAVDTVLLERKRSWNYRQVQLAGFMDDQKGMIKINGKCPLTELHPPAEPCSNGMD